jgi:hypothetical protein
MHFVFPTDVPEAFQLLFPVDQARTFVSQHENPVAHIEDVAVHVVGQNNSLVCFLPDY